MRSMLRIGLVLTIFVALIFGQDSTIAQYSFAGNTLDGSGNENTATISGAAFTSDRFNIEANALNFDGIDDSVGNFL